MQFPASVTLHSKDKATDYQIKFHYSPALQRGYWVLYVNDKPEDYIMIAKGQNPFCYPDKWPKYITNEIKLMIQNQIIDAHGVSFPL